MLIYEADRPAYLDRMRRVRAHLDLLQRTGEPVNIGEWSERMKAILNEVPPLELVSGRRYRMRVLAGTVDLVHRHYEDESGRVIGIDVPGAVDPEYLEVEGRFVGRTPSVGRPMIMLELAGGTAAALSDIDILRVEILPRAGEG